LNTHGGQHFDEIGCGLLTMKQARQRVCAALIQVKESPILKLMLEIPGRESGSRLARWRQSKAVPAFVRNFGLPGPAANPGRKQEMKSGGWRVLRPRGKFVA
jgi:hypothetical protein